MIRQANSNDFEAIASIYNHYILNSHATFELKPIDENEIQTRVNTVQNTLGLPWLVMLQEGILVGYAYATQWKARQAYSRSCETSVYIHQHQFGKGYGKALYKALISELKQLDYHALIGGISLPNDASIRLHESLGYKKIGEFEEVGFKFERWINVGYWQLIIP